MWRGAIARRQYRRMQAVRKIIRAFRNHKLRSYIVKLQSIFKNVERRPDLGKSIRWPEPPKTLRRFVDHTKVIFNRFVTISHFSSVERFISFLMINLLINWLIKFCIVRLNGPLNEWMNEWLIGPLNEWMNNRLTDWLTDRWRASKILKRLPRDDWDQVRTKIAAFDCLHGRRRNCHFDRRWQGNYLATSQENADSSNFVQSLHGLRSHDGFKLALFSAFITKVNRHLKSADRAILITEKAIYKLDDKKFKSMKSPLSLDEVSAFW